MAGLEENIAYIFVLIEENIELLITGLVFFCVFLLVLAIVQHFAFRLKIKKRTQSLARDPLLHSKFSEKVPSGQSMAHQKLSRGC